MLCSAALPPLEDISAYEYYLLGRQRMRNPGRGSRGNADRSIEYFRRAIAVEPTFARAYAGLAEALLGATRFGQVSPLNHEVPRETAENAEEAWKS